DVHWNLIRASSASVADTAVHPMQDILGLGTECRMNLPGKSEGYWEWRFDWSQVEPEHASRLKHLTRIYGRSA
ncbi:MAG: 4-alpha-glucanotransferase, partial [Candidatus Saccharibacteria bacterium]|nr:4-alpha-glucanotransferase [Rhodoferax sp.]